MEKVIFNGEINGVKFDTIEAYNSEIYRLKEEGCDNIVANASTQIINTPDECECNCDSNECKCGSNECNCCASKESTPNVNLTPLFDGNRHYLDIMVSKDSNENALLLSDLKSATNMWAREIVTYLRRAGKDEALSYIKDVNSIIEQIARDREDTRTTFISLSSDLEAAKNDLTKAQAKYDNLNEKMHILNDCNPVMDTIQEFYERMRVAAQDLFNEDKSSPKPLPKSASTTEGFIRWIERLLS